MVKVSVILPIYNVAPYLEEAFESILNQSLREIEVIAVNDGSTDNSEEIIKKYKKKDSRIIFFSQENQGQSVARNLALQHTTGEYIYMMDSDDVLSNPDVLLTCYNYAEKNHADFIFFDRDLFTDNHVSVAAPLHSTQFAEENKKYDGESLLNMMLDTATYNCVVWLLLISRQHLNSIGLKFYPGIIHEDELFTTELMLRSNSVYCLKQSLVKHRVWSSSTIGKKYARRNIDCYLTVADQLLIFSQAPIIHKFLRYTLSKVFYTGHLIPYCEKPAVFWRAVKSGYLKYIGLKSSLKFFTW
ncbi:MAG: glycosyltransferase [Prevotella sp.]|nr:glycosyltransferase [Prevotella sp.]